jgi:hypothetical protein
MQQTETLIEKDAVMERCSECMKSYKADELENKMCKMCKAAMETSSEESAVEKATEESSQAVGEESSQVMGEESSREGGVAGVDGKATDDDEEMKESSRESDDSDVEDKEEDDMDHVEEEMATTERLVEAVARIEAMLSEYVKSKADDAEVTAKSVKTIDERLAKIEKSASRGPVRTVVKAAPAVDETVVKAAKAAAYRAKAAATTDPALAEGYLLLAGEAENN